MVMALGGKAKIVEEAGEMLQIIGKILAFPYQDDHPDGKGSLKKRLEDELGDLLGSIRLVTALHGLDHARIHARSEEKFALFAHWHSQPTDSTLPPEMQPPKEIVTFIGLDTDPAIDMENVGEGE